jgi:two-component system sensor histidine kinase BaeS
VTLPSHLSSSALDPTSLIAGDAVSGERGALQFAAVPFALTLLRDGRPLALDGVVVLSRRAPSGVSTALPWLVVTSLGILLVAVVVADGLSRRLVRPLRAAEEVTARIASGDLSARVSLPPDADDELSQLGASINVMGEELTRARLAQRQFFLSVSHDLRTPLSAIRGYAEALEDGTATDAARAGGIISSESRRLERLVQDILELGRLELRQFSLRNEPIELGDAVASTVAAFQPAAAGLGVGLLVAPGAVPQWVVADRDRLAQVLANLVENALDHAAGAVVVGHAGAQLWVEDDGPGIAPEARAVVFEPFVTVPGALRRRMGTGLGLAIVAELARAMGGRVAVDSPVGPAGGTRFTVALQAAMIS